MWMLKTSQNGPFEWKKIDVKYNFSCKYETEIIF